MFMLILTCYTNHQITIRQGSENQEDSNDPYRRDMSEDHRAPVHQLGPSTHRSQVFYREKNCRFVLVRGFLLVAKAISSQTSGNLVVWRIAETFPISTFLRDGSRLTGNPASAVDFSKQIIL